MKRGIRNRVGAGLIAFAMVLAQVLLPVSSAYATGHSTAGASKGDKVETPSSDDEPKKVFVCKYVTTPGGDEVASNIISVSIANKNYEPGDLFVDAQDLSYVLSFDTGQAEPSTTACPTFTAAPVPQSTDPCNLADSPLVSNVAWLPYSDTEKYSWTLNTDGTLTVTAKTGYFFKTSSSSFVSSITYTLPLDSGRVCIPEDAKVSLPVPSTTDPCGPENASWAEQTPAAEYSWSTNEQDELIATAKVGFYFMISGQKQTVVNFGQAKESGTLCPTPKICTAVPTTLSTNKVVNGWNVPSDAEYVDGGIKLNVSGDWDTTFISRSMVGPLADIGNQVAFTASPSQYVGIHITTDKGILTYEYGPGYDGKWWSESAAFGVASGMGYATFDTLENIVTANPDVKTSLLRVLYTHPVASSSVITSVTVGCMKYTFDKEVTSVTVCPAGDLPLIRSTDKDANGWTLKGSADYIEMDGGIKLNVPGNWKSSYISRAMVGPLADIGSIVEFEATPEQYVGIHIQTTDGRFLTYEYGPEYDNKWWSGSEFGVASGQGYETFDTLENIVAANPDVMTSKLYVLYTHPSPSSSVITSVTVGCTEFVFSKTGGSGGVDTPIIPTTPVTPTTPVVAGKGALLPEELPMTGQNGSILFTWIALLAAILTYGSVYYLQPKKRFEQ